MKLFRGVQLVGLILNQTVKTEIMKSYKMKINCTEIIEELNQLFWFVSFEQPNK